MNQLHGAKQRTEPCRNESRSPRLHAGARNISRDAFQLATLASFLALSLPAQMLQTRTYRTTGHPTEALATSDGQYVLVTVNPGQGGSGIDVFRNTAGKLERIAFQPLGMNQAQGIVAIPHTGTLAVGLSNAGVAFVNLQDTLAGKSKVTLLPQGDRSGSGYLAVTPDGRFLFVANEYGDGGNIGVIALHPDDAGAMQPETVTHIRTPNVIPGLALSPDGTRLYGVSEVLPPDVAGHLPGHGIPELQRSNCQQGRPGTLDPNGALIVIDVAKAEILNRTSTQTEFRSAIKGISDAGCSPVRETVSADGSMLYITARGDDHVLVFNAKLLETDPAHAFLRAIPTSGEAPVGLRLFDHGNVLVVANSNRFAGGPGNAVLLDLTDQTHPKLRQTIQTGAFPRNITASSDGATLYMTIFGEDELMVLSLR